MKRAPDGFRLGSARPSSRACGSDGALAIASFSHCARPWSEEDFGEGAEISTRGECAPQNFCVATRSTRAT